MKSGRLQKLIRKIYSDEATRSEFLSNPEVVLSRFGVRGDDKKALLQTHCNLGLVSSNSSHLEATVERASWWTSPSP